MSDEILAAAIRETKENLERDAANKGFDHRKTSLWKLTDGLDRWLQEREKEGHAYLGKPPSE